MPTGIKSGLRCESCGGAVLATNDHGLSTAVLQMWAVTHDGHEVTEVRATEAAPVDRGDDE